MFEAIGSTSNNASQIVVSTNQTRSGLLPVAATNTEKDEYVTTKIFDMWLQRTNSSRLGEQMHTLTVHAAQFTPHSTEHPCCVDIFSRPDRSPCPCREGQVMAFRIQWPESFSENAESCLRICLIISSSESTSRKYLLSIYLQS